MTLCTPSQPNNPTTAPYSAIFFVVVESSGLTSRVRISLHQDFFSLQSLYREKFDFLSVKQGDRLVVHENHAPLKGCEPQTGVSVRLIFSDYDGVGDWEKTDLR